MEIFDNLNKKEFQKLKFEIENNQSKIATSSEQISNLKKKEEIVYHHLE